MQVIFWKIFIVFFHVGHKRFPKDLVVSTSSGNIKTETSEETISVSSDRYDITHLWFGFNGQIPNFRFVSNHFQDVFCHLYFVAN